MLSINFSDWWLLLSSLPIWEPASISLSTMLSTDSKACITSTACFGLPHLSLPYI